VPFTFAFDPAARIVRTTAHGLIRFDDLATHVRALVEAGLAGVPKLIDARHAQHDLSPSDIRRFVDLVTDSRAPDELRVRTALVLTTSVDDGMARMYGPLAEKADPGFAVFRDLAEGEAWLHAAP
jgi:hypothetical protein